MTSAFFEEPELQSLLEKIAKDQGFKQPTFCIGDGSKLGQNYVGRVFRAVITENEEGKEKSLSLIFKASSTNRARQEMFGGDMLFWTEKETYEIILPILNNLLKKHGVADHPVFPGTPRCFATEMNYANSTDKADIIVLEDMKSSGFEVTDMKTGLSGKQCRLALEKLALLHATSMALHELEPETAERLRKLLDKEYTVEAFAGCFDDMKRGYIRGLEMLEDPFKPGNPTYDKLCRIGDNLGEEFIKRFERPEDLYAIVHTDCSSNNLMFKLNKDGLVEDACLIDFQTATCTSIANDLGTLLLMCTKKEVRDEHFDNLLKFYFDEVRTTLQAFGCDSEKIFPWALFQKHLKSSMKFGVMFSLLGLPVMLAGDSERQVDIHSEECSATLFSDTVNVTNPETIKEVKRRLTDVVGDSVKWGYI